MVNAVGNLIKRLRQASGATQSALGRNTKIPAARISKIESGMVKATPDEIAALSRHFQDLNLLREYWRDSPMHDAAVQICDRMGIAVKYDIAATAQQFGTDIISRTLRLVETCNNLPDDAAHRYESLILVEQEALAIGNLAAALRMLVCEVHGK